MKFVKPVLFLLGAAAVSSLPAQIVLQDYSGITSGTTISSGSVADYSQTSGTAGKSVIIDGAGYPSGNGLRLLETNLDVRYRTSTPFWTQASGEGIFSVDFMRNASISSSQIFLSNYGGAGFAVEIGTTEIKVSSGGASVYTASYTSTSVSTSSDTWYTVEIVFNLSTGVASNTKGTVTIYETANPSNVLLDSVTITAAGEATTLTSLNQVDFRRFGGAADTVYSQYDNMQLTTVPEASQGAMLLGVLALAACLISVRKQRIRNRG